MGLVAAVKRRWFGPKTPPAPALLPPVGACDPWRLCVIGTSFGDDLSLLGSSGVVLTAGGVVNVPIWKAGIATRVQLLYGNRELLDFPLATRPNVCSGDSISFDLVMSLQRTGVLAAFGADIRATAATLDG